MSLRSYLIIMIAATLLCWIAFGIVILTVNPQITNWVGFLLFYVSLFLAIVGATAIIGFVIRFIGLRHELASDLVIAAFRQSFLFAFFIVIVLFLLARDLFGWLNMGLLIIGLSIVEFFLLSYKKNEYER
ncbi:MAG: hypothetical protein ABH818_00290 [Patescibacteria group bacterium]|nr:hypothetical protein [Patescibacteria group bacterium]MBU1870933.1 hypothetical protein [Patescibacteria group bacterium]